MNGRNATRFPVWALGLLCTAASVAASPSARADETGRRDQQGAGVKPTGQGTSPAPKPVDSGKQMTPAELFAKASPAVVRVVTYDKAGRSLAQGSGFFISAKGTVVTNHHVIEDAASISVVLTTNAKLPVRRVLASDAKADLAILETGAVGVPFLRLANKDPAIGARVYAIGNPLGLKNTISDGLVAGFREDAGTTYLQTTAAISKGSSGGPLLTLSGEVVGITTFRLVRGQSLNFAVVQGSIKKLLAASKATVSKPGTAGKHPATGLATGGKHYKSVQAILGEAPKELYPKAGMPWTRLQTQLLNKWMKDNIGSRNDRGVFNKLSISGEFKRGEVRGGLVIICLRDQPIDMAGLSKAIVQASVVKSSALRLSRLEFGDRVALSGVIVSVTQWLQLGARITQVDKSVIRRRERITVFVSLAQCSVSAASRDKPKVRTSEQQAKAKLGLARTYLQVGRKGLARKVFESIVKDYSDTPSAKKAKEELGRLK